MRKFRIPSNTSYLQIYLESKYNNVISKQ